MGIKADKEIFGEHMIAETINKDLRDTLDSLEMNAFVQGLKFKSDKTKEVDKKIIDLLVKKMRMYAHGWIQANANKTAALWEKSKLLDEQREALNEDVVRINNLVNGVIKTIKERIPKDKLEELRSLELAFRKGVKS